MECTARLAHITHNMPEFMKKDPRRIWFATFGDADPVAVLRSSPKHSRYGSWEEAFEATKLYRDVVNCGPLMKLEMVVDDE